MSTTNWTCPECKTENPELTFAVDITSYRKISYSNGKFNPALEVLDYEFNGDEVVRDSDAGNERIFCECGYYLPTFELTTDGCVIGYML